MKVKDSNLKAKIKEAKGTTLIGTIKTYIYNGERYNINRTILLSIDANIYIMVECTNAHKVFSTVCTNSNNSFCLLFFFLEE